MKFDICKIYASSNLSKIQFIIDLSTHIGGTVEGSFVSSEKFETSLYKNDEFDPILQTNFPDGFLYFKFILDIEFIKEMSLDDCVMEINNLLKWIWSKNIPAIAVYDYEELLTQAGGYKSKKIPWPK